jgi:hypothetical protein
MPLPHPTPPESFVLLLLPILIPRSSFLFIFLLSSRGEKGMGEMGEMGEKEERERGKRGRTDTSA